MFTTKELNLKLGLVSDFKQGFFNNPKKTLFSLGMFFLFSLILLELLFLNIPYLSPVNTIKANALSGEIIKNYVLAQENLDSFSESSENKLTAPLSYLPSNETREVDYKMVSTITAYNSEVAQCNDQPCITANGYNLCTTNSHDTVAANHLRLGTKIRIPELFGDKVFVVRDRMNARYSNRVDVWMEHKEDAIIFGLKRAEIEVLK